MNNNYVGALYIQALKKGEHLSVPCVRVLQGRGVLGDRHADVCLMPRDTRRWMKQQTVQGLCFSKIHENILLDLPMPCNAPRDGTLAIGESVLRIAARKKGCYAACPRAVQGLSCQLREQVMYAEVCRGGKIHVGDTVKKLSHFDENGHAIMVDITEKAITKRTATARGRIRMEPETLRHIEQGTIEKGDVLGTARIAGIMATKQTAALIPMCHPLLLQRCSVDFTCDAVSHTVTVLCTVQTEGKTGVEMEALTGASVALLTIYDMCKAIDRAMVLEEVCLLHKDGGKSGVFERDKEQEHA